MWIRCIQYGSDGYDDATGVSTGASGDGVGTDMS